MGSKKITQQDTELARAIERLTGCRDVTVETLALPDGRGMWVVGRYPLASKPVLLWESKLSDVQFMVAATKWDMVRIIFTHIRCRIPQHKYIVDVSLGRAIVS